MAKTNFTMDEEAIHINTHFLDPISHYAQAGKLLRDILYSRFNGNMKNFKRYIKQNINASVQSVIRYIALADNYEDVKDLDKLCIAYKKLNIAGNIEVVED